MLFQPVDAAMLRGAILDPGDSSWPTPPTGDDAEAGRQWLLQQWQDPLLREAIEIASPDLYKAMSRVVEGRAGSSRRITRCVTSLLAYRLRARSRATPFGMFAGIAPVRLGRRAVLRWGERHRAVAGPGPQWLAHLRADFERDPAVLRHAGVVVHQLAELREGTVQVPCPATATPDEQRPWWAAIRLTRPVRAALDAAATPAPVPEVIGKLAAEFPSAPEEVLLGLVADLVATGVLLTDLAAPMTCTDPLQHLLAHPATAHAPEAVREHLAALAQVLSDYPDTTTPGARRALRRQATGHMRSGSTAAEPTLTVDVRLDVDLTLPPMVAGEAAAAAEALVALTPYPGGTPAWAAWHRDFLERYGPDAIIPVTEAVADLGFPAGYRDATPAIQPGIGARDRLLLRTAQGAALAGRRHLELADAQLRRLADAADSPLPCVPHTELRFALAAATPAALDSGEFRLWVAGASRTAGTTLGRFVHLLAPADQQRIHAALAGLPTVTRGAETVQASSPPPAQRIEHLGRSAAHHRLLHLAEHPGTEPALPLNDLAVTADAHRMQLVQPSTGRTIEPATVHAVSLRSSVHPLVRFVCELPTALAAGCLPFQWGPAISTAPFLPRLSYRRTVLSPARWNITAADLPDHAAPRPRWSDAWTHLQTAWRIPRHVTLGDGDRHLGLDLDEPSHRHLLRTHLDRTGAAILIEQPTPDGLGWIGGRAHEIVLPLASTAPPQPPPPTLRRTSVRPAHAPGRSLWLYAQISAAADRHTAILTRHLPRLLESWPDRCPAAWFLRYPHPTQHLRLRIPLSRMEDFGDAAARLGDWVEQLRRVGLADSYLLATYRPETGRYGHGPALAAAETLFAADSDAVLAQLAATAAPDGPPPAALTAASLLDLAAAFTGSTAAAADWFTRHRTPSAPAPERTLHTQTLDLADPTTGHRAVAELPGGPRVEDAWRRRAEAAAAYRTALTAPDTPEADRVLGSLLHLHHARMIGLDTDSERTVRHLARTAARTTALRRRTDHADR